MEERLKFSGPYIDFFLFKDESPGDSPFELVGLFLQGNIFPTLSSSPTILSFPNYLQRDLVHVLLYLSVNSLIIRFVEGFTPVKTSYFTKGF